MHTKKILHRDLKPENILVSELSGDNVSVKVADFGIADFLPDDPCSKMHMKCGTPCYVAPEMLNNEGYREKLDIFSLGSILFNLATGLHIFSEDDNDACLE